MMIKKFKIFEADKNPFIDLLPDAPGKFVTDYLGDEIPTKDAVWCAYDKAWCLRKDAIWVEYCSLWTTPEISEDRIDRVLKTSSDKIKKEKIRWWNKGKLEEGVKWYNKGNWEKDTNWVDEPEPKEQKFRRITKEDLVNLKEGDVIKNIKTGEILWIVEPDIEHTDVTNGKSEFELGDFHELKKNYLIKESINELDPYGEENWNENDNGQSYLTSVTDYIDNRATLVKNMKNFKFNIDDDGWGIYFFKDGNNFVIKPKGGSVFLYRLGVSERIELEDSDWLTIRLAMQKLDNKKRYKNFLKENYNELLM